MDNFAKRMAQRCNVLPRFSRIIFYGRRNIIESSTLTFDSKVQRLAARLVQCVRRCADVATGAAPCHALQDEALIRPDDPRRRVVRQDLVLRKKVSSVLKFIAQQMQNIFNNVARHVRCSSSESNREKQER